MFIQNALNLNKAVIPSQEVIYELVDYSTTSDDGVVRVFFRNLEEELIELINQADLIVGCVAWLTSEPILDALAKTKGVSIVVQKEDFLRPDSYGKDGWKTRLRALYDKLPSGPPRGDYDGTVLIHMSVCRSSSVDPVRCVGNHNHNKQAAFPRCHHKFIVFCKQEERWFCACDDCHCDLTAPCEEDCTDKYINTYGVFPYAVWSGSFNFTKNATASLENALYITDPDVVYAFYREWSQILAISEPLDWTCDWSAPEWRLGT